MSTRVPSSTYRLQLSADFTFEDARELLPYLSDLGVGWVYLSPVLQAASGSNHGYDVTDPSRIDEERGGEAAFDALCREAHRHGLGVLVDIVPNHVSVEVPQRNPWWWDVLARGQQSAHAAAFDIDWEAGGGKVLLPILGDDDVEGEHISALRVEDGLLRYHDHAFPIAEGTEGDDPEEVHARQHYALRPWREESTRLNYRRFFAVSTLAAVRVEDLDVFRATHAQLSRWFAEGLVDGVRVDHPDGLRHPHDYLVLLADLTGGAYTLVEKILEPGEELPVTWPVDGTTGYDALGVIDRVLVDPHGAETLAALDTRLRHDARDWGALLHDCKIAVTQSILAPEVRRLGREVRRARPGLDEAEVLAVLEELLACFPVYRSYLPDGAQHLEEAAREVRHRRSDLGPTLEALLEVLSDPLQPAALRFQQTSGMVMAKGGEDRAFYRWGRLATVVEVGGDPAHAALEPDAFHAQMADRQRLQTVSMTALSTHDTKRGEDVRARASVLSERPDWWRMILATLLDLAPVPDPGAANLLWQTIVGCWPASEERVLGYVEKALREAGQSTGWIDPDEEFESAYRDAVHRLYGDPELRKVLDGAAEVLAAPGWSNSLAAKLLSLTIPGVPDVYQGSELWEQSLVDPDNRRPVDFAQRAEMLAELDGSGSAPAAPTKTDDLGAAKLHVVRTVLRLRRDRPDLFSSYTPVEVGGPSAEHALAFDRGGLVVVVTRLPGGLADRGGWDGATQLLLPPGSYRDVLTDRPAGTRLADLLDVLPVAVLVKE